MSDDATGLAPETMDRSDLTKSGLTVVPPASAIGESGNIAESDFSSHGTPAEKLHFLLHYAVMAPSICNTQPWLFKIQDDWLELHADHNRALVHVDTRNRELVMSCGAALFHLRVALRYFGYQGIVETFPDATDSTYLARISLGEAVAVTETNRQETNIVDLTSDYLSEEHLLFKMMPQRHTNRRPFEDLEIPATLLETWQQLANEEGAWLYYAQDEDARQRIADFVESGTRLQWADPAMRSELARWVHAADTPARDGVPEYAYEPQEAQARFAPIAQSAMAREAVAGQTFSTGVAMGARIRRTVLASPVLVVLGTQGDTPQDWLAAGQALERVLLYACAVCVSASFLNQPLQVAALRRELQDVLNHTLGRSGYPQLVLRMGYGPEILHTPRRPLEDVSL